MQEPLGNALNSRPVDIGRIFASYEDELRLVEQSVKDMFESDVFLISLIGRHLVESGGKRMRPLFLLAAARLSGYRGADHIQLAGIIESVHTASLLHDDVVDGADLRRGKPSAHSIWGNQTVILVGDFMYSNALKTAVSFKNQKIMEALSAATTNMTRGELLQLQKSGDVDVTEDEYLRIISAKTGALISAACRIGGVLGGVGDEKENALGKFGMQAGIAFQMADDILDYMADESDLGKKLGKDMEEGKVTLPLLCLLKSVNAAEKAEIGKVLESGPSPDDLARIMELFRQYNALEESVVRARKLVDEAKRELVVFPDSPERAEMFDLAEYALQRGR
jgi:octaprenyl-diphosphate synthase